MKSLFILCWLAAFLPACSLVGGSISQAAPSAERAGKESVGTSLPAENPTPTRTTVPPSPTVPASKGSSLPPNLEPTATAYPTPAPLTQEAIDSCPVTVPDAGTVPEGYSYWGNFGNDAMLVTLSPGGKIVPSLSYFNADGSLGWKISVYRFVKGKVDVSGKRLDAPAPPAVGYYDMEGYGDSGFQAGGVDFPSAGCWEITARVANASLTFVTLVVKPPADPLWPHWLPDKFILADQRIRLDPWSILSVFRHSEGGDGEIIMQTAQGSLSPGDQQSQASIVQATAYPTAAAQQVMVHGVLGVCIQGAWDAQGEWQAGDQAGTLEWTEGDFNYRISSHRLGLTCAGLLRIAGPDSPALSLEKPSFSKADSANSGVGPLGIPPSTESH